MRVAPLILVALAAAVPGYFLLPHLLQNTYSSRLLLTSICASVVAYIATVALIPAISELTAKAGLAGKDLNKGEAGLNTKVPESLGLVPGIIYVVTVCLLQVFIKVYIENEAEAKTTFIEQNAGLFTSCFMIMLGFADDVLNLRWRYKLVLPSFAALPLLLAYQGVTTIVVPKPLQPILGQIINLGILYRAYMGLVVVYCSNTINIYAGINGLEAGQTLVIACAVAVHNAVELAGPYQHEHLFSLVCMIPFIAVTLGLLYYNWYPSRVFVGDTFTYFAGVTLAVCGILGHFSKTLMLFFIPQWLNFLLSIPQLTCLPCPRHRLPIYDEKTKKLRHSPNHTLLNATLWLIGPTSEQALCVIMLSFQVLCCAFGFYVRYSLAKYFYDN